MHDCYANKWTTKPYILLSIYSWQCVDATEHSIQTFCEWTSASIDEVKLRSNAWKWNAKSHSI